MTAKRLSTRLAFSLMLAAAMAPWVLGETRHTNTPPVRHRIWTPSLYGLNMYHYLGPITPYAPGFFPLDGWYGVYYPPLFEPPRYNPALPGSVPAPWQYRAPDWYYRQPYAPYIYPPPFYGGYYQPNTYYWWHYRYFNQPWTGPGWHSYRGMRDRQGNSQAPTEVPRSR
jgi:hypothetical protein